jgi:hypothetical protein
MPKEREIKKPIPRFYKKTCENLGLFFFVKAQQQIVPTIQIEQGIMNYFRFIGVTLDEWDMESAKSTYNHMQRDFYETT